MPQASVPRGVVAHQAPHPSTTRHSWCSTPSAVKGKWQGCPLAGWSPSARVRQLDRVLFDFVVVISGGVVVGALVVVVVVVELVEAVVVEVIVEQG